MQDVLLFLAALVVAVIFLRMLGFVFRIVLFVAIAVALIAAYRHFLA